MTYKEAAHRVATHMETYHISEYPHAVQISEALKMALDLLNERAALEDCANTIKKGSQVWYVDYESGEIEEGEVFSVQYKDQHIDSFSVEFKETEDFDEFFGKAIGDCFFLSKEMAEQALINGHGVRN